MAGNIREALQKSKRFEELRQHYIGKKAFTKRKVQRRGRMQELFERFHACDCPDGLTYTACVASGDSNGVYHWQSWVRQFICKYCGAGDQETVESYNLQRVVYLLFCPKCYTTFDMYEDVKSGKSVDEAEDGEA